MRVCCWKLSKQYSSKSAPWRTLLSVTLQKSSCKFWIFVVWIVCIEQRLHTLYYLFSISVRIWSWLLIIYIHTRRCQVACEKMEMLSQLTGHWHCCCYCVLCNLSRIVCPHSVYLSTRCWQDTSHWISRKYLSYLEIEEMLLLLAAILCQQECSCIQIF